MDDLTLAFLRAITSLAVTLALVVLAGWVVRHYGLSFRPARAAQGTIHVQETKRLNQHTTLHRITCGDDEHLIATTAAQTTVISTRKVPKPAKVKS